VALAQRTNPEVLKAAEQINYLNGRVLEARADALPEATIHGNFNRYADPSMLNSPGFSDLPAEFRNSFLPRGSNLWDYSLEFKQALYSFKLSKAIRAARIARSMGQEDLTRARQQVALDTVTAYNRLLFAMDKLHVAEDSVARKEKHLEMTRNRRTAGVATQIEVYRTEVDLANDRAGLLRAQGEIDLARGELNALMLRPIDAEVEPTDSLVFLTMVVTLDDITSKAIAARPELATARLTEDIRKEAVGIAKAEGRPSLDMVSNYGISSRLTGDWFNYDHRKWATAVMLRIPVFQGYRVQGKVQQAQAELEKSRLDTKALANQIRLQAQEAYTRLTVAEKLVSAAQMNVSQAQQTVDMIQANYKFGAATYLDVIDAQSALVAAQNNLLEGLHAHADARASIRYIMGENPLDENPAGR
jgi:outer membrane protein TolC